MMCACYQAWNSTPCPAHTPPLPSLWRGVTFTPEAVEHLKRRLADRSLPERHFTKEL